MSQEPTRENVEKELDSRGVLSRAEIDGIGGTGDNIILRFESNSAFSPNQRRELEDFGLKLWGTFSSGVLAFINNGELNWQHVDGTTPFEEVVFDAEEKAYDVGDFIRGVYPAGEEVTNSASHLKDKNVITTNSSLKLVSQFTRKMYDEGWYVVEDNGFRVDSETSEDAYIFERVDE